MVGKVAAVPVKPPAVINFDSDNSPQMMSGTMKDSVKPQESGGDEEVLNPFSYRKHRSDAAASASTITTPPLSLKHKRSVPSGSRETLSTDADTTLGSSTSNSEASPGPPRTKATGIMGYETAPATAAWNAATTPLTMYATTAGGQQSLHRPEDDVHCSNLSLRDMYLTAEEDAAVKEGASRNPPDDENRHLGFFPSFEGDGALQGNAPSPHLEQSKRPAENPSTTPSIVSSRRVNTPPSSLDGTPTDLFSRPGPSTAGDPKGNASGSSDQKELQLLLPPAAVTGTSVASSTGSATSSLAASSGPRHHPVLYSAIGSLEDPSSNSYGRYYWNNATKRPVKVDFPSTAATTKLIPPAKQAKNRQKKSVPAKDADVSDRLKTPTVSNASLANRGAMSEMITTAGDLAVRADSINIPSSLRSKNNSRDNSFDSKGKKVTITEDAEQKRRRTARRRKKKTQVEMFRPCSDAYTPRMGKKEIKYKPQEMRTPVPQMSKELGTLSRPNFKDALRRVAMILRQHIVKIEQRSAMRHDDGLFSKSMKEAFSEEAFCSPTYKCTMVRVPMARPGMVYGLKKTRKQYEIPSEAEIYEFGHQLFESVQLSSECSIVCLIYVERLMEIAKVPLLASTWRPIFMCGLLLASKVWQDLSSWNIEFSTVYPQFSLDSINRLELQFLRMVKWDLYISSSLYAKYYFALRSLLEKPDFRQRYNRMVGGIDTVQASEALKIEQRSSMIKEEALAQLSRSM